MWEPCENRSPRVSDMLPIQRKWAFAFDIESFGMSRYRSSSPLSFIGAGARFFFGSALLLRTSRGLFSGLRCAGMSYEPHFSDR